MTEQTYALTESRLLDFALECGRCPWSPEVAKRSAADGDVTAQGFINEARGRIRWFLSQSPELSTKTRPHVVPRAAYFGAGEQVLGPTIKTAWSPSGRTTVEVAS